MASKLSLNPEQLELLCSEYHSSLIAVELFERLERELPLIEKRLRTDIEGKRRGTRLVRIFLRLVLDSKATVQPTTEEISKLMKTSEKTTERDLAPYVRSHILLGRPRKEKGTWGKRGSRKDKPGRPPMSYSLNPVVYSDLITNDSIDLDTRKSLSIAEKFLLLGSPTMRDARTRLILSSYNLARKLPLFADSFRRLPEYNNIIETLWPNGPPALPADLLDRAAIRAIEKPVQS